MRPESRQRRVLTVKAAEDIAANNRRFIEAIERSDAAAVSALYTEDAIIMPAGSEMIHGRAAIRGLRQAVIDMRVKGGPLQSTEVEELDNMAVEVSKYTPTIEGGQAADVGKYVVARKREAGEQKLHRDIWNTGESARADPARSRAALRLAPLILHHSNAGLNGSGVAAVQLDAVQLFAQGVFYPRSAGLALLSSSRFAA